MMADKKRCEAKTEVYTRVTGFYRPVQQWNKGKKEEYKKRVPYKGEGIDAKPKSK